jgi:hypothetical protein
MPRHSSDEALVANVEIEDSGIMPGERPAPPANLSDDEAKLWVQLVDSFPPHYFPIETQPLLEGLVGHVFIMKKIMAEVRDTSISKSEFKEWARLFTDHTMAAGNLATKLRLTQSAHISIKAAQKLKGPKAAAVVTPKSAKSWDVIRN